MSPDSYEVRPTTHGVDAWSEQRLPFEPKGWLKDFRDELQHSLRALMAASSDVLYVEYAAPTEEFADLENVLLSSTTWEAAPSAI